MKPLNRVLHIVLLTVLCLCASYGCAPTVQQQAQGSFQTGEAHYLAGEYTAAEEAYRQALQHDPQDPAAALALTQLYATWGRPDEALIALEEAVRRGAGSRDTARWRITLLGTTGEWEQVQAEAKNFLRTQGEDAAVLNALTHAYMHARQCAMAGETAKRWYAITPENAVETWGALSGQTDLLCQVDSSLCPSDCDRDCDLQLGYRLVRENAWPLATCVLERALSATPDSAEGEAWLGEALSRIGYSAEALIHLQRATNLAPEDPLGWVLVGTYYLQKGDSTLAREALLQAHQLDPNNPAICLSIAEVKGQMGRYEEVLTWVNAALERSNDDVDIWKSATRFYLERHLFQDDLPMRAAKGAFDLAPQDAEANMLLGWTYLVQGDASGALFTLDNAIHFAADLGQAHYLRGLALQSTGEITAAQAAFIRAADLGYRAGE